jgi:hypothetical protein
MKQFLLAIFVIATTTATAQTSTAYVEPGQLRTFLDYNMEASVMTNSLTPSNGLHGGKYQWVLNSLL